MTMKTTLPYISSQKRRYREGRQSVPAGGVVYLEPHVADRYMKDFPGLLRPAPVTAQAHPDAVRSDESADAPEAPKPRRKRAA